MTEKRYLATSHMFGHHQPVDHAEEKHEVQPKVLPAEPKESTGENNCFSNIKILKRPPTAEPVEDSAQEQRIPTPQEIHASLRNINILEPYEGADKFTLFTEKKFCQLDAAQVREADEKCMLNKRALCNLNNLKMPIMKEDIEPYINVLSMIMYVCVCVCACVCDRQQHLGLAGVVRSVRCVCVCVYYLVGFCVDTDILFVTRLNLRARHLVLAQYVCV